MERENPIFAENEREANRYSCRCLQVMALIAVLAWLLNLVDVFIVPTVVMPGSSREATDSAAAFSISAIMDGVANTGSIPLPTDSAVHSLVT